MGKGCLMSLAIGACVLIIGCVVFGIVIGTLNSEAQLATTKKNTMLNCQNKFDNMWKKIRNIAEIPPQAAESLRSIFSDYAAKRSGEGENKNLIMNWIKESVPTVAAESLPYKEMMNLIVATRDSWTMDQTQLIELHNQHEFMFKQIPKCWILKIFGRQLTDITIITSGRTKEAYRTGEDNEVDLFPKK